MSDDTPRTNVPPLVPPVQNPFVAPDREPWVNPAERTSVIGAATAVVLPPHGPGVPYRAPAPATPSPSSSHS